MDASEAYKNIMTEMKKRIAGKEETIELMFIALVANGHTMLEGVPGVAKTTMTKTLAATIKADFKRIQGTPDLEPRDIVGYAYTDTDNSVKFSKGPVFTNILLVDEFNRIQPKTMSAFLETLEERQTTVGGVTMPLPQPFITFAVQNPIKIEGTEQIPKVLTDRFLMKIDVDYPSMEEEQQMLRIKQTEASTEVKQVIGIEDLIQMQQQANRIAMPDDVTEYITRVIDATRKEMHILIGASPRADIAFMNASKARALVQGRNTATKEDIKFLAKPVLSHRITIRASGGIGARGLIDGMIAGLG